METIQISDELYDDLILIKSHQIEPYIFVAENTIWGDCGEDKECLHCSNSDDSNLTYDNADQLLCNICCDEYKWQLQEAQSDYEYETYLKNNWVFM